MASSSSAGTSTNYARQDHTHGITLATGDSNGQVKIAGSNVSVKGWNTAATYDVETTVANDSKLPTGAAVKSFVEGKGYITTDTNTRRAFYGTCATAAATKDKVVTLSNATGWELLPGTIVGVKFTYTNTYASATDNPITLNVNSTGAKNIWYNTTHSGAGNTGTNTTIYGTANRYTWYMYDGTYWVWIHYGVISNANTIPSAQCETAAATAAKTASLTNHTLTANTYCHFNIRYANTAASAITMNVDSSGAKPIYINGTASSSSNYTLPAGTYIAFYNGTNWYFRTDGKLPADISGDAATVNGHSVAIDVPANAKFTDTTYTAASATPKMDGTGTVGTSAKYAREDHVHPHDSTKVDKVDGKGLSTNDFTDALETKLNGIAAGAEVNVQSDWNVTDTSSDAFIKNKPAIPTKTSDLTNDSNFVSDANYVHTDNNFTTTLKNKLDGIASGAEVNVQSDWNETNTSSDAYIKNKPTIPTDTWKAFYGTCSTAAATAEKAITISADQNFALRVGAVIGVKFTVSNTASNVKLNVNSTGAKSIWYNVSAYTGASSDVCGLANRYNYYMYDGTYWCWLGFGLNPNSNTIPTAYCATAAGTAAKAASCTNYNLLAKSYTILLISTTNTAASALTLNINGKGAKPIYINGTASSASNHTMPAGSYLVYYDGTNYYIRTDGKITGSITGDATTVGGHTVGVNVPSSAVFTDTQSDWSVTDSSSAAFIKNKPTIPTIESHFTLSLASTTWSSTTTTVNSIPYYTATVAASSLVKEYPTIYCGSSSTLPSRQEKDAFNLIDYAIADLTNHNITFYATIKPTVNLTINVIG